MKREILDHLAAGATNAQIANALGISPATARKHLEHTYEKLRVSNRTAAAARVAEVSGPRTSLPASEGEGWANLVITHLETVRAPLSG